MTVRATSLAPALIELADPGEVAEWVAERILRDRLLRPQRPIGLATGRTMEPVYRALQRRLQGLSGEQQQRLLGQWLSFNLDEYVGLGREDPGSFATEMEERLVRPLGLRRAQVRLPDGWGPDPDGEALRYRAELERAGGIGLQLLGLGGNGHVGFNEPPCGPDSRCRVVGLSASTLRQIAPRFAGLAAEGRTGLLPDRAITLGLAEILAAERILLVVTGAAKAEILRRALEAPPTPELPASWLQLHPQVTLVADREALGRAPRG